MKPVLLSAGLRRMLPFSMVMLSPILLLAGSDLPLKPRLFNTAPVAVNDSAQLISNISITASFIINDSDPDEDSLSMNGVTIVTGSRGLIQTVFTVMGGTIEFFADGRYTYTPALNFIGYDQVAYTICDVNAQPLCASAFIFFKVGIGNVSLPVGLSVFSGRRSGKDNLLQWTTMQESNSHHFELEYSNSNLVFETLATLTARGSSSVPVNYSYVHRAPPATINFYRLKIVDKDWKVVYSKTLMIRNEGTASILNTVYPNPFLDNIELVFTATRSASLYIRIFDANGKLCMIKQEKGVSGLNILRLTGLNRLQPGTYFVKVAGKDMLLSEKIYKYR